MLTWLPRAIMTFQAAFPSRTICTSWDWTDSDHPGGIGTKICWDATKMCNLYNWCKGEVLELDAIFFNSFWLLVSIKQNLFCCVLSIHPSIYPSIHLSIHLSIYQFYQFNYSFVSSINPSIHLSTLSILLIYLSIHLSIYRSILSMFFYVFLFLYISTYWC
jgi:hypothetical protein